MLHPLDVGFCLKCHNIFGIMLKYKLVGLVFLYSEKGVPGVLLLDTMVPAYQGESE